MRDLLFLLALLAADAASAQSDRAACDAAADRLRRQFNAGAYDSIFFSFSPDMQRALPRSAAAEFFGGLRRDAGRITDQRFHSGRCPSVIYRTRYEHTEFLTELALDPEGRVAGLLIRPDTAAPLPVLPRNRTAMTFPLRGEWTVFWGGDTREENYHVVLPAQQGAIDLVMQDKSGRSFRGSGTRNEDFYAFGQPLLAPCNGEVVVATDGIPDNSPGVMNAQVPTGNTVLLKTATGEYVLLAHIRKGTVRVRRGQKVRAGALIGQVGNSGNSSEAHLHLHLQDRAESANARGIKCYFTALRVNGVRRASYSPVRSERVAAAR